MQASGLRIQLQHSITRGRERSWPSTGAGAVAGRAGERKEDEKVRGHFALFLPRLIGLLYDSGSAAAAAGRGPSQRARKSKIVVGAAGRSYCGLIAIKAAVLVKSKLIIWYF